MNALKSNCCSKLAAANPMAEYNESLSKTLRFCGSEND